MTAPRPALFARLRALAATGPLVVAHRGDSRNHPENTLAAFRAAAQLGVAMQEFDVQSTRDGELVCLHDAGLDRTTDAARRLGPGALLAQTNWDAVQQLDAGSWHSARHAGERVPRLREALAAMLPHGVPLIEHKAGRPEQYAQFLAAPELHGACILQSFDWEFVAAMQIALPQLPLAVLGPNRRWPHPDDNAIAAALATGAGMLHWHANELTSAAVERAHRAGLLVCTYTTDDELGWAGGRALGFDAMCTNDPTAMLRWRGQAG